MERPKSSSGNSAATGPLLAALTAAHQPPHLLRRRNPQRPHTRLRLRVIVGEREHRHAGTPRDRRHLRGLGRGQRPKDHPRAALDRLLRRLRRAVGGAAGVLDTSGGDRERTARVAPPHSIGLPISAILPLSGSRMATGPGAAGGPRRCGPGGLVDRGRCASVRATHRPPGRACRGGVRMPDEACPTSPDNTLPDEAPPHGILSGADRSAARSCACFHANRQPRRRIKSCA